MGREMQRVKIHAAKFECGICTKKYPDDSMAKRCFEVHSEAINALIAQYKPGVRIKAYYFNEYECGEVFVTIIKTKGELTNFEVLVEHENGSRWWVKRVIGYQVDDCMSESIKNKPTNFWANRPLVS